MRSNEKRDAFVNACVTKRQKAALADFCWQNRITMSELLMTLVEDFISEIEIETITEERKVHPIIRHEEATKRD